VCVAVALAFLRLDLFHQALDAIELLDKAQRLAGPAALARLLLAQGLERLIELAPHMRPAADMGDAPTRHHGVVTLITIGLQVTRKACQQPLGHGL
jgi:hypothetical protein